MNPVWFGVRFWNNSDKFGLFRNELQSETFAKFFFLIEEVKNGAFLYRRRKWKDMDEVQE